ncbi:potassium-transporting ATPase subunit C [Prescottella equi]|uniref:Potassium-transporting ATPase KdpC subunit n=2 Tax=Rhodococcus hoagii TaxID=43767 RepID=E9T4H5_RHOHA|nr:potassium-transporting ATPase subunit C [Prescottella equi]MBU4613676.1 potassium-transporting ATPase subunit C [Rhodococcus sp. GG48]MCD7051610.1 potassium-transporting ATPase subunit C [Rhodococcus sp. BH2-1]EGD22847.1 putative K+-transporting ATPase, C subunit [Prescottella equi ATCC 33707]ERN44883.1 potassium transporter atpase c subunit kdpc [Prescottella equi NBRC 101255 = C 7]MBM4629582.1 potassium-transporting ATPase subunit C [Prescottella equi]
MRFAIGFLKQVWAGLLVLLALTAILGVLYPAAVWGVGRIASGSAEGSPVHDAAGCVVGSRWVGVDPQVPAGEPDPFFHNRVVGSVADEDPFAPGDPAAALPGNQGPSSEVLAGFVEARRAAVAEREGVAPHDVPVDAVTGSGSGIDPHISPAYAQLQVPRVAAVTGLGEDRVRELVAEHTEGRQLGFLGAERVNVLELNVALGLTAPGCNAVPAGE